MKGKGDDMADKSNVPAVPALGGEASLNRYLSEIRKFPILTPEQEYMLAKRYAEHQDSEAAAQLVTSHLRLVAKIAMDYRGYGLPVSELTTEGNIDRKSVASGKSVSLRVYLGGRRNMQQ